MLAVLAPTDFSTIWPHQVRYRQEAQATAQALFDALDEDLQPQVLVLALPYDPASGLPTVLEPANADLPLGPFADAVARGRTKHLLSDHAYEAASLQEGMSQEMLSRRFEARGVRAAVQETLAELDADEADADLVTSAIEVRVTQTVEMPSLPWVRTGEEEAVDVREWEREQTPRLTWRRGMRARR